ncbi:hypothetical protein HGB07_02500 [Candidatus Roizmanbacteria bacterium]|nr:hypothetical protein [Candidatus Roizmanbacteria bacterium]
MPVIETIEADLTSYIATNVMGMTDGHIFFDSNAYNKGRRPAINIQLSVTRVGKQTQTSLVKEINREVMAFLSKYEHLQQFSHFGAELSAKVKAELLMGERLYSFFNQDLHESVPDEVQLLLFAQIWLHQYDSVPTDQISRHRWALTKAYTHDKKFFEEATSLGTLSELLKNVESIKTHIDSLCQENSN